MNNKGFNWFFPIAIMAFLLFFGRGLFMPSTSSEITEEQFFDMMKEGKVQNIKAYRDNFTADVFLTPEARTALAKNSGDSKSPFAALETTPGPDYNLKFGELRLLMEKFDKVKAENPQLKTTINVDTAGSLMESFLIQIAVGLIILSIIYFIFFRKMAGGGGPGGQIFSIGKSRAKLFDEKDKVQTTFKDVAGLEGAKEEVQEVVDFLKNSDKYTKLGGKIPKGVLLVGPPGTG